MLNALMKLFDNVDYKRLEEELEKQFSDFDKNFSCCLKTIKPIISEDTSFVDVGGHYEMKFAVQKDTTENNIKIYLEGDTLEVNYKECNKNSERLLIITETLPKDADDSTLDASVVNGMLIITVDKLESKK